jgi:hypothetical protein
MEKETVMKSITFIVLFVIVLPALALAQTATTAQPAATPITDQVIRGRSDRVELIVGGGYYSVADNTPPGHGWYTNGRLRYRPLTFKVGERDLTVGLFAYGNYVSGVAGEKLSPYDKFVWAAGPTTKLYGNRWDLSADLGVGQVRETSPGKWGYNETQTVIAPFGWGSHYGRRLSGHAWFAKTEVGLSATIPVAGVKVRDMRTGNLYFTQWVKDWGVQKDVRFSLGVESNVGYDMAGTQGHYFLRIGPAVSLELKNQSIATVSFSRKVKLDSTGDLWLVNASVNLGHVARLIRKERR